MMRMDCLFHLILVQLGKSRIIIYFIWEQFQCRLLENINMLEFMETIYYILMTMVIHGQVLMMRVYTISTLHFKVSHVRRTDNMFLRVQ